MSEERLNELRLELARQIRYSGVGVVVFVILAFFAPNPLWAGHSAGVCAGYWWACMWVRSLLRERT
jgi:hypothetical protein